ncbi:partial Pyruvate dehydrogenase E1 component, partial [uncultured bacterium]
MNNTFLSEITGQLDIDPAETKEWIEALQAVLEQDGSERAHFLIEQLVAVTRRSGFDVPFSANTAYLNTIPVAGQAQCPGDATIELRIRSYVRWNAMMMVLRANKHTNVGGHIASFASAATLYDVGYNHFWRASSENNDGD